jgi:hypothetical protein
MRIAGIGSRKTPEDVLVQMERIGAKSREEGWTINSGHAEGADYAFEKGAMERSVIYLPWPNYNKHLTVLGQYRTVGPRPALDALVKETHPAAFALTDGAFALHRRNCCIVLGFGLDNPVDAVVCWTVDGGETGGTGQAMRLARRNDIPVLNLFSMTHDEAVKELLSLDAKKRQQI